MRDPSPPPAPDEAWEEVEDAYDLRGSCGFTFGNGCSGGESETNLFGSPRKAKNPMEIA